MSSSTARSRRRRVAVVTGTRAEYGVLQSTMQAIQDHSRLKLQLVVTGMHLIRRFGHTVDDIVRDGWSPAVRVAMQKGNDTTQDQAEGLGRGVRGIAKYLDEANTDIVVVLGDRIEAMAGALAAVTTGRILAHIHGGDVAAGDFDDSLRHAITKLAHVHLTATQSSHKRVVRMGEESRRVYCVGAPGLDQLREMVRNSMPEETLPRTALIVQHPIGRSKREERKTALMVLESAASAGLQRVIIYPNTDRGHLGVIDAIDTHRKRSSNGDVQVFRSLDRDSYLKALIDAKVLVGNSSSGIIEAGMAGTPSVNVGSRQAGREVSGPSVIHTQETPSSISRAITRALRKRPIRGKSGAYGTKPVGPKIAAILAKIPLHDSFRRKTCSY